MTYLTAQADNGRLSYVDDMYGRDLRVIRRLLPDGSYQNMADEMRRSGLAHRYAGGFKTGGASGAGERPVIAGRPPVLAC